MPGLEVVAITALTLLLAELGDKTQLAAVALASQGRSLTSFASSTLGFITANLLTIPLGQALRMLIPQRLIGAVAGALFLVAGLVTLLKRSEESSGECGFARGFTLMFLAELGDKTNLATLAIAASTGALLEVVAGLVLAAVVLMGIATSLGSFLCKVIPRVVMRKTSGALFTIVGIAMLLSQILGS
ncbi:MAG: TMEM165/GDT1 family protein [Thermofilaceae archaeon]|nr:TMEM165/GDT1 family protein [Thermofilaceae archaeon]